MLNILVWLCTDEFLAKEWPFVCHGSSAKQHRLNWLFQRWEVNVVTIYKCKVPLHWPNTLRQCCASVVTYSYKRWDNIRTCYRTTLSQHVGPTEGNFTLIHCDNIVFPTLAMDQQNEPMLAQRKHATVPHCFERVFVMIK